MNGLKYSAKEMCDNCKNWKLGICRLDSKHHDFDDVCKLFSGDDYYVTAKMILDSI